MRRETVSHRVGRDVAFDACFGGRRFADFLNRRRGQRDVAGPPGKQILRRTILLPVFAQLAHATFLRSLAARDPQLHPLAVDVRNRQPSGFV